MLHKEFVACSCDGCSAALLNNCIHNPVYQEFTKEQDYFKNTSNERIYFELVASVGYTNQMEKLERNEKRFEDKPVH